MMCTKKSMDKNRKQKFSVLHAGRFLFRAAFWCCEPRAACCVLPTPCFQLPSPSSVMRTPCSVLQA